MTRRGVGDARSALMLAAGAALLLAACTSAPAPEPSAAPSDAPYRDASLPVTTRVADLLARMTTDEKIGQLTAVEQGSIDESDIEAGLVGSVLAGGGGHPTPNTAQAWTEFTALLQERASASRLGIPLIYAVDAVHGLGTLPDATVFPHQIGLGATHDADLVAQIGAAVGDELSALGVDQNYAPVLAVVRDDRWGRTYESYGEDPDLVSELGSAYIRGLQSDDLTAPASVLATAKHYLGDGDTAGGVDRGDVRASDEHVREVDLPPYQAAVDDGVRSVMVSFSSIDGQKMHGSSYWLTDVLRDEVGFTGFTISDWAGIDFLDGDGDTISAQDVREALNAGVDMVMVPDDAATFRGLLADELADGGVSEARLDEAVSRVLTVKFEAGLFDGSAGPATARLSHVGSLAHRTLARRAVAESVVVLQNDDDLLPLRPTSKVLLAGEAANDLGVQCGGWCLTWQGSAGAALGGTSIWNGVWHVVDGDDGVTYSPDGDVDDPDAYDAAIVVVGEQPYAEYEGDVGDGPMTLSDDDAALVAKVAATGLPTVMVLMSGRPLDITAQLGEVDAVAAAWLPGSQGDGVTDVLFGLAPATGTLPVSWPSSVDQEPINDGDGQVPAFPLGWGITYPKR